VPKSKGEHGYDPKQMKTMRAIFYAVGPDIRPGVKIAPFENVNIFPLIVRILGLNEPVLTGISKNSKEFFKIQQKSKLESNFFRFLKEPQDGTVSPGMHRPSNLVLT
jgi:hypothetical protein